MKAMWNNAVIAESNSTEIVDGNHYFPFDAIKSEYFSKTEFFKHKRNRFILLIIGLFILQLILVFLVDERDFSLKFYGTNGRNTGFIAYLSLSFLLLAIIWS